MLRSSVGGCSRVLPSSFGLTTASSISSESLNDALDRTTEVDMDCAERYVKQLYARLLENASYRRRKTWMDFSGRDLAVSYAISFDLRGPLTVNFCRISSWQTMNLWRNIFRILWKFISLKSAIFWIRNGIVTWGLFKLLWSTPRKGTTEEKGCRTGGPTRYKFFASVKYCRMPSFWNSWSLCSWRNSNDIVHH